MAEKKALKNDGLEEPKKLVNDEITHLRAKKREFLKTNLVRKQKQKSVEKMHSCLILRSWYTPSYTF